MLSVFLTCTLFLAVGRAENIVFPPDSGVIDLTQAPYGAKGDGVTDNTAIIQKALDENYSRSAILYLPNGTYLISGTLTWGLGPHAGTWMKDTILQGQSEAGTIIKLKDNSAGFQDATKRQHLLFTGKPPAQRFRNAVRNLTLDSGIGNPGAAGVLFYANNQGSIRNVTVRSGDGAGTVGIDFNASENGPLLGRHLTVEGFDVGIDYGHAVNSITLEHVSLRNQRVVGIRNRNNIFILRGLKFEGEVSAVINEGSGGMFTLVEAELVGRGAAGGLPAIINQGKESSIYLRDIRLQGFGKSVANPAGPIPDSSEAEIEEWVSHPSLQAFPSQPGSLRLPIQESPDLPWDPLDQWISPLAFGGNPNDGRDDSDAIQAAIDSGKTTVYLPLSDVIDRNTNRRGWILRKPIILRGNVRRLIGTEGFIRLGSPLKDDPEAAAIIIGDGTHPVVSIERISFAMGDGRKSEIFRHEANRTLLLSSVSNGTFYRNTGGGDLFIDDVVFGRWHFASGQNVWARQLNPENKDTKIFNQGANLWILGLKTESRGTIIEASGGGNTEILGAHIYSNENVSSETMFIIKDSNFSAAGLGEYAWKKPWGYSTVLEVSRGSQTRIITDAAVQRRGFASQLPLFVEHAAAASAALGKPDVPQVSVEAQASYVVLDVKNHQRGVNYRVVKSLASDGGTVVALFSGEARMTIPGLTPLTDYSFQVTAISGDGGEASADPILVKTTADVIPPTVVGDLKSQRVTPRRVQLRWTAAIDDVKLKDYVITREPGFPVDEVATTELSYFDTTVQPGQSVVYRVKSRDAAGNLSAPATIEVEVPSKELASETLHPELYVDGFKIFKRGPIVGGMEARSWARVSAIDLGGSTPWTTATWRYGSAVPGAIINLVVNPDEIRLVEAGNNRARLLIGGTVIASHQVQPTGGFEQFQEFTEALTLPHGGVHDIYITFDRGEAKRGHAWLDFDGITFSH